MKALQLKPTIHQLIVLLVLLFIKVNSDAQNASDYVLFPGNTFILPVDQQMKFAIQWITIDDLKMHLGINSYSKKQLPVWTINGEPSSNQNPANGKLIVDLGIETATYTAPSKIPTVNPVTIAVRFYASDTSKEMVTLICNVKIVDPDNKWYVSFTYLGFNSKSDKSATEERTSQNNVTGSASMLIDGTAPDKDGNITINTSEGDNIVSYASSGQWGENILEISKDLNGVINEKTIRDHKGTVTKDKNGIEFEYDPSPGGIKGLTAAGLNYYGVGKDQFYVRNNNNKLVKKDESDGPFTATILLGHENDVLKKTAKGFVIDYIEKKDTSYTDVLGAVHKASSYVEYHVTISRKGNHRITLNYEKPKKGYYTILPSFMCNTRSLSVANSSL